MATIVVGTAEGLITFDAAGGRHTQLEGRSVDAVAPASWKRLWAVVDGREIWRREITGGEWTQSATLAAADQPALRGTCLADTRANAEEGILVGTSQAHLVRAGDGPVERLSSFDRAPGREKWFTPWGGPPDVRSITEDRDSVFVNVHVGGVLRSRDGGESWQPTIDIHADVHRVVTGAGRVYAAGARGLSVSGDGGDSWRESARGLHAAYCRSVTVCGQSLLLSASDGPGGGRAAVYRSDLDGIAFQRCRKGLPEWFEGNIDSLCLDALPDGSFCAFGSEAGALFTSTDQGSTWAQLAGDLPSISCVLVLP